jgi:hypothetical protein
MKIDNENNIGMKQSWETSFNLFKVIPIDASKFVLFNDEIQSLVSLLDLKLFKKCSGNFSLNFQHYLQSILLYL